MGMASRQPRKSSARSLVPLDAQSDEEVIARMISCVTAEPEPVLRARTLLSNVQQLASLAGATPQEVVALCEVDPRLAGALSAGIELGIRCCERAAPPPSRIQCSEDVARVLGPRLRLLDHEQLWILALDASSRPIGMRRLAEGGRDVLRAALSLGACSFVLAHNHPGGDPAPSRHDVKLTDAIAQASACIGLPLVDHVILTRSGHASMLDLGLLEESGSREQPGPLAAHDPPSLFAAPR